MTDTNETTEDVIAWLRRPREGENAYLTAWRDEIADRLEAAHRRERGDCAKLREALEEARRIASDLGGCRLNDYWKLNEIVRVCEAALATTSSHTGGQQMAETNETIADIIAEMETERPGLMNAPINTNNSYYARRLKAAHKRELSKNMSKSRADFGQLSNAAKLREALEAIDKNTDLLDIAEDIAPKLHPSHSFVAVQIRKIVRAALAEPPRNCDVGTAEEQDRRFYHMFCRAGIDGCIKCRLNVLPHRGNTCGIHWAQMPYEEGGAS